MIILRDDDDVFSASRLLYKVMIHILFFARGVSKNITKKSFSLFFFQFSQRKKMLRLFIVMFLMLPSLSTGKQFNYSCALEKPLQGKFHQLCCRRWLFIEFSSVLWRSNVEFNGSEKLDMISFSHWKKKVSYQLSQNLVDICKISCE